MARHRVLRFQPGDDGGFALLFLSPGVSRRGIRLLLKVWVVALIAAALLAAFMLGTRMGRVDLSDDAGAAMRLGTLTDCPRLRKVEFLRRAGEPRL